MSKRALITGASSGIGLELAKVHASRGGDLVLVARRLELLETLKSEILSKYNVDVLLLKADLSLPDAGQQLYNTISSQHLQIDYLINNAGFGEFGEFVDTKWERERDMIQLNVVTLVQLTKLYVKEMVPRGSGRILNVASVAGFIPGPWMSIYYSTKAFVLSFSQALAEEVRGSGVTVTVLCPGPTESGFLSAANLENSGLFKVPFIPSSATVALYGYNAMVNGKTIAIQGFSNKLIIGMQRLLPKSFVVRSISKLQRKVSG